MSILDFIPVVQEWQLRRLMDKIIYKRHEIVKMFPGFMVSAYFLRQDGIDWVDVEQVRRYRVIKTMGQKDLQFHHDTMFRRPHRAIQTTYDGKLLTVGFWCDNIDTLEVWLKEQLPDVYTPDLTERVFIGQIPVEAVTGTPVHEHQDGGEHPPG